MRTFETPATLDPARTFSYQLHAEWIENGQTVVRDRTVEFRAGNQLIVNLLHARDAPRRINQTQTADGWFDPPAVYVDL